MNKKIVVMLVEDSESDALLVERELRKGGFDPVIVRVISADEMSTALQTSDWDIVIADYNLPQFCGLDAYKLLSDTGLDVPFILVSGSIGEEVAVEAMRQGVNDYVMKSNLARLAGAVERELRESANRTARRAAEEQLKQAERLRTIGELMSSVIHDLKNPLHAILLSAELLVDESFRMEELKECHDLIVKQVQRIVGMSDDILEFARGNVQLSLRPLNPAALLREIVDTNAPMFRNDGIELTYDLTAGGSNPATITADYEKLWRVFQNLINNAKDAMPGGGEIHLSLIDSTDRVIFEVRDSGGGIPIQIRDRLFDPFVTHDKPKGTGLGLSIVKSIVEGHHGSVNFSVDEGIGTTFRVSLPVHQGRHSVSDSMVNTAATESR